jgi:hypothetical protein
MDVLPWLLPCLQTDFNLSLVEYELVRLPPAGAAPAADDAGPSQS